jgi:hypothetical protein
MFREERAVYRLWAGDLYKVQGSNIEKYAALPAKTAPTIKLTWRTINDGHHRVQATKLRGDKTIRAVGLEIDPTIIVSDE